MRRVPASVLAVVATLGLALGLAGCTSANDGLANTYKAGTNQGFISGDGRIEEIPADQRGEPVSFTGTEVDGATITSDDYAGEVLVLNFWYAGCGPCRAEAGVLEAVHSETKDAGASFLGVNIFDRPEQATAFEKTYGITYPSLLAADDAALKLTFADWTSVQSAPTTLVLDKEGRVAARIFGSVAKMESILSTIVDDAIAEQL